MRFGSWIVVGGIAVLAAAASGAARTGSSGGSCGHEQELIAAKLAMERGDKEGALRHLKNADALLARCLRGGVSAPATDADEAAETRTG